jgi:hypothetical protein
MSLGGISRVVPNGGNLQQGAHGNQNSDAEFSLEQQNAGSTELSRAASLQGNALKMGRVARIVDRKKRNRKGAPRTVLVDGEIYEVYLLAIA